MEQEKTSYLHFHASPLHTPETSGGGAGPERDSFFFYLGT